MIHLAIWIIAVSIVIPVVIGGILLLLAGTVGTVGMVGSEVGNFFHGYLNGMAEMTESVNNKQLPARLRITQAVFLMIFSAITIFVIARIVSKL